MTEDAEGAVRGRAGRRAAWGGDPDSDTGGEEGMCKHQVARVLWMKPVAPFGTQWMWRSREGSRRLGKSAVSHFLPVGTECAYGDGGRYQDDGVK